MIYLQIYIIYDYIFIWKNLLFNGYCHSLLVQYWLRVLQRLDKVVIVQLHIQARMENNQVDLNLKKYVVKIHYIRMLLRVTNVQMVDQIFQRVRLIVD